MAARDFSDTHDIYRVQQMTDIIIGIDAGGTKTAGVAAALDEVLLDALAPGARTVSLTAEGANPNDLGARAAGETVARLALELCEDWSEEFGGEARLAALFCAAAGATSCREEFIGETARRVREIYPAALVDADSDAAGLLSLGLGAGGDGCALISGTGSSCFTRIGGKIGRIGGWGYLLDGLGSGYDLGRDAISEALRFHDGRGGSTAIREAVLEKTGGRLPEEMIYDFYKLGKPFIASFASCVFEAEKAGDAAARAILDRNMAYLAELVETAARSFGSSFRTVLGGGIITKNPTALNRLAALVPPACELYIPEHPAEYGALWEARGMLK